VHARNEPMQYKAELIINKQYFDQTMAYVKLAPFAAVFLLTAFCMYF